MKWTKVPFGKYAGKTLPQIAFIDPDWLFWLIEKADLYGPLAREAAVIERCATHILLKDRKPNSYAFEWVFDNDGGFSRVEVVSSSSPANRGLRYPFLDLSVLRQSKPYDKGGYRRLIRQVRQILFGDDARRLTKKRCERFFNDDSNFG